MKNIYLKAIIAAFALFILFQYFNQQINYPKVAFVEDVIDGDTILLSSGKMVRLLGLNTPETKMNINGEWREKESLWGERAYLFSKNNLKNKKIRIEYDREKKDRYGRLLGYVFSEDNFINQALLSEGLAVIDVRFPNFKYLDQLSSSFKDAKERGKGIWSDLKIIGPNDLSEYDGEIVAVEGVVIDVYNSEELLFFLLPSEFKFVIFKKSLPSLKIEEMVVLKDEIIRVSGMVKRYKSSYQMVIHHPYQLEVLR
ncbi:MAG: thermonuclease family protein [Candidatus Kaelpia aquatica]|nr:thermonuclease family protein [Candidatus Kaelpia aquatica]